MAAEEIPEGTIKNVLEQESLKWVFVGGKGGVGKTTCSSILSILLASVRSSVLIISTDPAHNLSDAFQQRFTKSPTLVNGFSNLYAMGIFCVIMWIGAYANLVDYQKRLKICISTYIYGLLLFSPADLKIDVNMVGPVVVIRQIVLILVDLLAILHTLVIHLPLSSSTPLAKMILKSTNTFFRMAKSTSVDFEPASWFMPLVDYQNRLKICNCSYIYGLLVIFPADLGIDVNIGWSSYGSSPNFGCSHLVAVPHPLAKKILKSTNTFFRMVKSTFVDFEPASCEAPDLSEHKNLVGYAFVHTGLEVDPTVENEDTGSSDGMDGFLSDLANSIPGIDEAMSFAEMLKLVQTMDYSVIVFDTAPTGHTLRLLQFPSTLEKGLDKMMSLKNKFGGLIGQSMTSMFGMGEFGEDAILGKLEGMKDVIEQVNRQFKDPDMTTFVCVCIPEFLSLYETERLVQELTKFEIDTHNIIINQVLFDEEGVESKLLKARMKMQQKYLDQFYMLYDDFNITKLPLLPQEVCGVEALKAFSEHFLKPYTPLLTKGTVEELEVRVSRLQEQLKEAEIELEKARKGKKPV
ncbi:P-loop containing nucleoside triphosphate hydrolases superfamily protein [Artemisia annua]|uniref:P-loop containing nucleoside triphosphate hydrolases superfamily protein n=1 Tax=Artemisia annua TaxID=35608 RepID=A0A2U1L4F0_ARTAN|nr:P-loop containing nucleoside triphosphate hydrolases superfamily protein [Artemisia annua]